MERLSTVSDHLTHAYSELLRSNHDLTIYEAWVTSMERMSGIKCSDYEITIALYKIITAIGSIEEQLANINVSNESILKTTHGFKKVLNLRNLHNERLSPSVSDIRNSLHSIELLRPRLPEIGAPVLLQDVTEIRRSLAEFEDFIASTSLPPKAKILAVELISIIRRFVLNLQISGESAYSFTFNELALCVKKWESDMDESPEEFKKVTLKFRDVYETIKQCGKDAVLVSQFVEVISALPLIKNYLP